jgi:hypothetical protein
MFCHHLAEHLDLLVKRHQHCQLRNDDRVTSSGVVFEPASA